MPGVGEVSTATVVRTNVVKKDGEQAVPLIVLDASTFFDVAGFVWIDGDDTSAQGSLYDGDAVVMPYSLARTLGRGRNDVVTLETVEGPHDFRVAGTYASLNPLIYTGQADGARWFRADEPREVLLNVKPGTPVGQVVNSIKAQLGPKATFIVETTADSKAALHSLLRQFLLAFIVILGLALVVGLLGLANTLAMSFLERTREMGVLRAIGASRAGVMTGALSESATLVAVALVLSLPLGWLLSWLFVRALTGSFGFTVGFTYPWLLIPVVAVVAGLLAALAAAAPARRAGRLDVVAALRFE